ncbi:MAG: DUF5684 domain-containing protein [Luteolibacter sp.]
MTSLFHLLATSSSFHGLLAQSEYQSTSSGGGVIAGLIGALVWLVVMVFLIAGLWKVFVKAGKPGWAAIVPIYNIIVMLEIAGKPVWWIVLLFIPFVNFIIIVIIMIALAKSFGKGVGYGIGCALLGFIFIPLLGFSDAKYIGPQA